MLQRMCCGISACCGITVETMARALIGSPGNVRAFSHHLISQLQPLENQKHPITRLQGAEDRYRQARRSRQRVGRATADGRGCSGKCCDARRISGGVILVHHPFVGGMPSGKAFQSFRSEHRREINEKKDAATPRQKSRHHPLPGKDRSHHRTAPRHSSPWPTLAKEFSAVAWSFATASRIRNTRRPFPPRRHLSETISRELRKTRALQIRRPGDRLLPGCRPWVGG